MYYKVSNLAALLPPLACVVPYHPGEANLFEPWDLWRKTPKVQCFLAFSKATFCNWNKCDGRRIQTGEPNAVSVFHTPGSVSEDCAKSRQRTSSNTVPQSRDLNTRTSESAARTPPLTWFTAIRNRIAVKSLIALRPGSAVFKRSRGHSWI
jgi:hypothetical protein